MEAHVVKGFRLVAIATAVACLVASPRLAAQLLPYRASLQVRLVWMNIEYGNQQIAGQGVVFRGEPLVVDVGAVNRYEVAPAAAEVDWPTRIAARWWRGGYFESNVSDALPLECDSRSMRDARVRRVASYVELEPGGSQFMRCRVRDAETLRLPAGKYTITVEWAIGADGQKLRDEKGQVEMPTLLNGVIEFELSDVLTPNDDLDRLNHLASHALLEGDFPRALQLADGVLRRQASSVTALTTRSRAHAARGTCKQALADWEQVAAIIEGNRDVGNQFIERSSFEEREVAAATRRQQVRTLKCS